MVKLFKHCKDDIVLIKRLKELSLRAKCYELASIVLDLEKEKVAELEAQEFYSLENIKEKLQSVENYDSCENIKYLAKFRDLIISKFDGMSYQEALQILNSCVHILENKSKETEIKL